MSSNDKPETITVYVSIGNSDDKLTQAEWARYVAQFRSLMLVDAAHVHGVWFSEPGSPYQNACVCAELPAAKVPDLRRSLTGLRDHYRQDSVAWAEVPRTEFI
ncbi:hypothetical protein GCM10027258_62840 [Amycolatopsis stemonae]